MYCTICGKKTNVKQCSRTEDGFYRYRLCPNCGHRMYTLEQEYDPRKVKDILAEKTKVWELRKWRREYETD